MTKILIIEDNLQSLKLMEYLLNQYDYPTVSAMDGEEGVKKIKDELPDLIICDIQLPKLNGYEVVEIIKKDPYLKNIPVVAVTAYAMLGDRNKIRAMGFDAYISKPINPVEFVSQIESLLPAKLHSNKQLNLQSRFVSSARKKEGETAEIALIVSDSVSNQNLFKYFLESLGFEVKVARQVKDAVAILQQKPPNLILSGWELPELNGLDFLRLVRSNALWSSIPFIIASATHPTPVEMQEAKRLNLNRFILLPVDSATFINILRNIYPQAKV